MKREAAFSALLLRRGCRMTPWATVVTALAAVMGCAGPAFYTATGSLVPPNTNRIYIQTSESPDVAFRHLGRHLQSRGYGIQSSDETLGSITTTTRDVSGGVEVQVLAVIMDENPARILMHGRWTGYIDGYETIDLRGQQGSFARDAWDELFEVAESYSGGELTFEAQ